MKLPNLEAAVVSQEKIAGYLLNPQHADGAGKAQFFAAQGFRADRWQVLAEALRRVAAENEVASSVKSAHGEKYIVEGPLETPRGAAPLVRTVWIVDQGETVPRLITAYPCRQEDGND